MPWTEATQKVNDEIKRKKNYYLSNHKKAKVSGTIELLRIAEEKLDNHDIEILKEELSRKIDSYEDIHNPLFTDKQFLQLIMDHQIKFDSLHE
jgi:hypothetical protein